MSHVPNGLYHEYPEYVSLMRDLKSKDHHFSKMLNLYEDLNHDIHRVETNIDPRSDFELEGMKKQRLALKDEIAGYFKSFA